MIDLKHEETISIGRACREDIPEYTGKPFSPQTACRWIKRGVLAADGTRVHLEAVLIGRSYVTTRPAVKRMFDELQQRSGVQPATDDTATEASLKSLGLLSI